MAFPKPYPKPGPAKRGADAVPPVVLGQAQFNSATQSGLIVVLLEDI